MFRRASGFLWLGLAGWFDRKGMAALADACLRRGANGDGRLAVESAWRLGKRLLDADRNREAAAALQDAVAIEPRHARAWCALGAAYRRLARMDEARSATEQALALDPHYPQALNNLGEWHLVKGDAAAGLAYFERALTLAPDLIEAANNRVAACYELGRFAEAESAAIEAIDKHPDVAALQVNYGNVLLHTGKARPAVKAFRRALEIDPACPEAMLNLSVLLGEQHRLVEALAFIEHEIAVKGESAQRLAALALAQQTNGDLAAAEVTCRKVLELTPNNVSALVTLAGCLSTRGDHRAAMALQEQALEANPRMPAIQSNIAFDATYLPDLTPAAVFERHRRWAERFEAPLAERRHRHPPGADPDKRLRIGYVSGDFGSHPVGFLIRDVLRHHDRRNFEIHCFSMMRQADEVTTAIRAQADEWHDVLLDSDDEVADKIREAGIDIAVDLSGHTAYNRLAAFALKPAPVQATWIGYFHSTGLTTLDYFITDPHTSPAGGGQSFSETPVFLPWSRFCYAPPDYAPDPAPPPSSACGHITFGCFNRLEKVVDEVVAAWARILAAVPQARLLLKAGTLDNQDMAETLKRRFAAQGIAESRLELRGRSSHAQMFAEYGDIDIALDPFPFNGGMTTLEALWMGVPVVTLAGHGVVSRQTFSALANLGLQEGLAFSDLDAYVAGAVSLARDPERLAWLRKELRPRMAASPLCQAERFSGDLERLYRQMWHAHCKGEKLPPCFRPDPLR